MTELKTGETGPGAAARKKGEENAGEKAPGPGHAHMKPGRGTEETETGGRR